MSLLETLNDWSDRWAIFMWGSLLDTTALLAVVSIVWFAIRRWVPAQLGYCLFLLVVIKPCVPGHINVSGAAAYLSPRYAIERLEAWASLDIQRNDADGELNSIASSASIEEVLAVEDGGIVRDFANGASSSQLSFTGKLMCGWAVCILCLLSWFFWSQFKLRRNLHGAALVPEDSLGVDVGELARASHVNHSVRIMNSPAVNSPAIAGLFRTCILLPTGLANELSAAQLRWVLLHEMAHIRRCDLWVAVFQRLMQIFYFWNPAVWLANRIIDQQREYACDDAAMAVSTTSRRECGAAFLSVLERANAESRWMVPALGFFSAKHCFRSRLMRILDSNRIVRTRFNVGSMAILLLLAVLLLPRLQAASQDAKTSPQASAKPLAAASNEQTSPVKLNPPLSDAEREAEAALKDVGARITRNNAGKVVDVSIDNPQLKNSDLEHLTKLSWSEPHAADRSHPLQRPVPYPRLHLDSDNITDEGMRHVGQLANLRLLLLSGTEITDDGLQYLHGLIKLDSLVLNTNITNAGLSDIKSLGNLRGLVLVGAAITDNGLEEHAQALAHLNMLSLINAKVTDNGLEHLKKLPNLINLSLDRNTSITGRGLLHLANMPRLRRLFLADTKIDDSGLKSLGALKNLEVLLLRDTPIGDAGLQHMGTHTSLQGLFLDGTKISGEGLVHLSKLTNLHFLNLGRTKVGDDGLMHLSELTNLTRLYLGSTEVGDDGLMHLKPLTELVELNLERTDVSGEAVKNLHKDLPKCKIIYDGGTLESKTSGT